jgi:hypothetical protein
MTITAAIATTVDVTTTIGGRGVVSEASRAAARDCRVASQLWRCSTFCPATSRLRITTCS